MDIVEVENLWVKYRLAKEYALRNINLRVKKGETLGIIGPTGAGKSTLCAAMAGLVPNLIKCDEFRGNVIVDGLDTREHDVGDICQRVGIVFQDYESQLFRTTVLLETAFGPENLGLPLEEINERIKNVLNWTRLSGLENKYTFSLSGGQKQRLAIASVISMYPEILILDEATSDLDPIGKYELYKVVKNLKKKKMLESIIIVDHHLDKIAEIVDRVIVLRDGEVVSEGRPREVFSQVDRLMEMGLAPPQVTELFHRLNHSSPPLTVEEAVTRVREGWYLKPWKSSFEKVRSKPAIELIDVWHMYEQGKWVLRSVNLRIHEGEFLALIGQNGSGKTTLAHLITGILSPSKGTIKLFGKDVTRVSVYRRSGIIGYVFQNPDYQIFSNTVKDELAFGPRQIGLPKEEIEKRVSKVAKLLEIEHLLGEDPFFLNKANRQRVAVASVLTLEPRIIILDEPTTGLSPGETRRIMDLVEELNRRGLTIIVITHDMWVVAEYCRRTVVLQKGEVKIDGLTREVFSRVEELSNYFLDPPQITQFSIRKFNEPVLSVNEFIDRLRTVKIA